MVTHRTPSTELGHDAPVAESRAKRDWWNFAMFSIGGVAALGLVVVLFGAYLTPNDTAIISGTIIMLIAVIAWILAACFVIIDVVKQWLIIRGKRSRETRS